MGNLTRQTGNEWRQLPLMLGKFIGGALAVGGFGATVWINTHRTGVSPGTSWLPLLVGTGGIVLFVLAGRRMAARPSAAAMSPTPAESKRMNVLAWSLLLLFVAIFLLFVVIFLR